MIFLCLGLPSSASTWIYNVVREVLRRGGIDHVAFHGETFGDFMRPELVGAQNAVIKSHRLETFLLPLLQVSGAKCIISARDPRDATASLIQRFGSNISSAVVEINRSLAVIITLVESGSHLVYNFEDHFAEKPDTILEIARFFDLNLRSDDINEIFELFCAESVKKFILEIDKLPSKRQKREQSGDVFDLETQFHMTHITDMKIGKWLSFFNAEISDEIDLLFGSYANYLASQNFVSVQNPTKFRTRPDFRLRCSSLFFSPIDDFNNRNRKLNLFEAKSDIGLKVLDNIFLPVGLWLLEFAVDVSSHPKCVIAYQNGEIIGKSESSNKLFFEHSNRFCTILLDFYVFFHEGEIAELEELPLATLTASEIRIGVMGGQNPRNVTSLVDDYCLLTNKEKIFTKGTNPIPQADKIMLLNENLDSLNKMDRDYFKRGIHWQFIDDPSSDVMWVSFSTASRLPGSFNNFKSLQKFPGKRLFLGDPENNYYQKFILEIIELISEISTRHKVGRAIYWGSSMGAYAAILFGALDLLPSSTYAFAPQLCLTHHNTHAKFLIKDPVVLHREYQDIRPMLAKRGLRGIHSLLPCYHAWDGIQIEDFNNLGAIGAIGSKPIGSLHTVLDDIVSAKGEGFIETYFRSALRGDHLEVPIAMLPSDQDVRLGILSHYCFEYVDGRAARPDISVDDCASKNHGWFNAKLRVYDTERNYDAAIAAGLRSIELSPRIAEYLVCLANSYTASPIPYGPLLAEGLYREALRLNPSSDVVKRCLVDSLRRRGLIGEADQIPEI